MDCFSDCLLLHHHVRVQLNLLYIAGTFVHLQHVDLCLVVVYLVEGFLPQCVFLEKFVALLDFHLSFLKIIN